MARTKEQVFKFLDSKEQIVGAFKNLMTDQIIFLGSVEGKDVRSVELVKIVKFDRWTKQSCKADVKRAEKILEELDSDFQSALAAEKDEAKKEEWNNKFLMKRALVVKGVETVKINAQKTLELWESFKQGNAVLTYDEIHGIINNYIAEAGLKQSYKKQKASEVVPSENISKPEAIEGLSSEETNSIVELLDELAQLKADYRKTQKALTNQWIKEFEVDAKQSGALFISKDRDLKEKYNAIVELCKYKYASAIKISDENIQRLDSEISIERNMLAKKNNELSKLKKEPIVKQIEAGDAEGIQSDIGQNYTSLVNDINQTKESIVAKKNIKKEISENRKLIDEKFKENIKNAKQIIKQAKEESLPDKKSKLMTFFGKLKAKFGIGKGKIDNADNIGKKALSDLGDLATSISNQNAKQAKIIGRAIGNDIIGKYNTNAENNDSYVA